MKEYNFIVLCAMGMSSGILAQKIKEAAMEQNIALKIDCYFSTNFKELDFEETDIILMAPQVHNQIEEVKKYTEEYHTSVMPIGREEYGLMRGKEIFQRALDEIKQ